MAFKCTKCPSNSKLNRTLRARNPSSGCEPCFSVLNDWNMGKVKYYTHPPEVETRSTHISAEIVTEYSKEFNLQSLDSMEQDDWAALPNVLPSQTMLIQSSGIVDDNAKGTTTTMTTTFCRKLEHFLILHVQWHAENRKSEIGIMLKSEQAIV